VTFTSDEFTVVSYPGPDRSVKPDELAKGRALSRRYRNRRIGEFLKELELTEGRGTGIPKILRAMKENGSPPPELRTDDEHTFFATVLPIHPDAKVAASDLHANLHGNLHGETGQNVLRMIDQLDGEATRQELQEALGLDNRDYFRKAYLLPALEAGLIEMTVPDKPNSRSQRYRLTRAGLKLRMQKRTKGNNNTIVVQQGDLSKAPFASPGAALVTKAPTQAKVFQLGEVHFRKNNKRASLTALGALWLRS